jgi:alpha-galactosidase
MPGIQTACYHLEIGTGDELLSYSCGDFRKALTGPIFEVDGMDLLPVFSSFTAVSQKKLNDSVIEYRFDGVYTARPELTLSILIRAADASPVLKFKYLLRGAGTLTKVRGERLDYCTVQAGGTESLTEVRFSEFNQMLHSFCMNEVPVKESFFAASMNVMGPLVAGTNGDHSFLLAYEHGSQYPDAFIQFAFTPEKEMTLRAVKGNYLNGTRLDGEGFESIWFDFGAVAGNVDTLAAAFREFQLKYATLNLESRKPYIFYNTWCFQERNKWYNHKAYLSDMNEERMMAEVEAAHEMGIDVFVIDTGWYEKTGDWSVNRARFADGMKGLKAKLDEYGMKLGLWIAPPSAAITSLAHSRHPECKVSTDGQVWEPRPIWETEESYEMCLVSPYWEILADTLIGLAKELGVSYFKWDAVGQYGCNSPDHDHGDLSNTPEERADSFAFQVGIYMEKIVNKVCAECPDVIVDFDITEGRRNVGLGFLTVGKYFLINNGPYFENYNIPINYETDWTNIFVHPGAPRTWICRSPLTFDKWIPSVLFLTHYLPDDPMGSQDINLASLILGQNGIWGDLPAISPEGRARFGEVLSVYKRVRDDITAEAAIKSGMTGSGFECYEKICSKTGKGVVCVFSTVCDTFRYITEKKTDSLVWTSVPATVTPLTDGTSLIEVTFKEPGAAMIFFGV